MKRFHALLCVCICLSSTIEAFAQNKEVAGWLEKVKLFPEGVIVHAKLDTGADYSSLNASDVAEYDRGKTKWVRFKVTNRYGEEIGIESKVVRIALIKSHSGKPQKRDVIRLGICLGKHYMEEEVNLVDRTKFTQQMLIGRNFLAGSLIIDPAMTFTSEPDCKGVPKH